MTLDRRHMLMVCAGALATAAPARAEQMSSPVTAYAFSFKSLDGGDILLASHAGHPMLVVNTASLCGYTPQYAGLQDLWTRYRARGLLVLGVPSNDFGGQEPGGVGDIHATAQGEYLVTSPPTEKVAVKGPNAHPFYKWARNRARPRRRAGISTNTWSGATADWWPATPRRWSRPSRASSRRSSANSANNAGLWRQAG